MNGPEIALHLLLGVANARPEIKIDADLDQVVKEGKQAHPRKFGDSGDEGELDMFFGEFDLGIKIPNDLPGLCKKQFVVYERIPLDKLDERRVVFIDQDDDRLFASLVDILDQEREGTCGI
jgi:hypothetical protein